MASPVTAVFSQFAQDVAEGLSVPRKKISPRYFYDPLGSALFEAITYLPEYGLTRADERLLTGHAADIARAVGETSLVCELGSGSGRKTRAILEALAARGSKLTYSPIDVSAAALSVCERELSDLASVKVVCDDWLSGLELLASRRGDAPLLVLFLGSSVGNLERPELPAFFRRIRSGLLPGDHLLIGADLVKDVEMMLTAYDDPTCVTAAFNLNLLGRMNRELGADFDLRAFAHEVRWNSGNRRIEMHLLSGRNQEIYFAALDRTFSFEAGETIWTESSHKFTETELLALAKQAGFEPCATWVDQEWPFAECLWKTP